MKYHLIGDQGISMRGIKTYLEHLGHTVTGSDLKSDGHRAENISSDINVVVRTSAVTPGSAGWIEVEAAKKLGIKVMKRSELLGELTDKKHLIAISGMHGKTTITTMAGLLLIDAGLDPTVLAGDLVRDFDDQVIRIGKSDWFVAEVCEYDRSFLDFSPEILILSNIEEEHLDTYPGGLPEIKKEFAHYLENIRKGGVVIACQDDPNVVELTKDLKEQVIYYGFSSEKYNHLDFDLQIPGKHNILNALSVVALGDYLGLDQAVVEKTLTNFHNAHRRFEKMGTFNGADLIDDYGHHPTEIKATLQALGERYPEKKKIVVFWPHQYKRIKPLLAEFGSAFSGADEVILKPIFFVPGRDEELKVSSDDLALQIKKYNKDVRVVASDDEIAKYLAKNLNNKDVLLTIGIPPVYKIAEKILEKK